MIPYLQALRLDKTPPAGVRVASTGAGGKTSALFALARSLPPPVLVTCSTHLGAWQIPLADRHLALAGDTLAGDLAGEITGVTLLTGPAGSDERLEGLSPQALDAVRQLADQQALPLLVEADGSRRRPLKAPAAHEPAVPPWARQVAVVAGLAGLGKPLGEGAVHRPERFAALAGAELGAPITPEMLARVLLHPQGGQKGIPPGAYRAALLTGAGGAEELPDHFALAEALLAGFNAVLLAAAPPETTIKAVFERAAGIVLAAGGASRFGAPKVLLDWDGKPLVRRAVETALAGGLAPVIVVTGAHHEPIRAALAGLPVQVVHNARWAEGQSASLRAGIEALDPAVGAALFLLADQPFLTPEVIRALRLEHAHTRSPVIAPQAAGRRANPVLFDRALFDDLRALAGDAGGRVLFERYPPRLLPWDDDRLLLDIDTPEDYRRLRGGGEP